jgi:predicted adenylyl cyclase CyaB
MEIEVKAKVSNLAVIRKRLRTIGAHFVKRSHQIDTYYTPDHRPLRKHTGNVLRVRYDVLSKTARLEFHITKNQYVAEENEVSVSDYKTLQKILKLLRAKPQVTVEKKREAYKKGKVEIVLDDVRGFGKYIEVEIIGQDTAVNRALVHRTVAKLGIPKSAIVRNFRYHQMALAKKGITYGFF